MKNKIVLSVIFLGIMVWPGYADADWGHHAGFHGGHHYYHYHDHPHFGVHVAAFYPDEYYSFWTGGRRYYYDDGVYYNYLGGDYVIVSPPVGAFVSTIPSDFQPVIVNGVTYYADNGTYYVHTPSGYKVVPPPVQMAPVNTPEVMTVNVPSNKGGYVRVTLRRSGKGFIGPQGEFYTVFPKVSQLQAMYGR